MTSDAIWESDDRTWFRGNPAERLRVRGSYNGEFDGGQVETHAQFCVRYAGYRDEDIVGIGAYTIVVKIDESTRLRLPYWRSELAKSDLNRMPVEAELKDGGETTPLAGFLEKLETVSKAAGAVTERYLEEVLPSFVVDRVEYDGSGPSDTTLRTMVACSELTAQEELRDSHGVRMAEAADHERHAAACGDYSPASLPTVLVVQPYPGLFLRMPFTHAPMKESDNYRFQVSAGGRSGTLGDYLKQARDSFLFASRMM